MLLRPDRWRRAWIFLVQAAVYVLWMIQRVIHGPVREGVEGFRDLNTREAWVIAPIVFLLIALGVYPKPLLDVITPSVDSSFSQVWSHDPAPPHPVTALNGGRQ